MFKRKRIAILASSLALATAGATAFVLVTAPAASASTQVMADIKDVPPRDTVSREIPFSSSTRGKVVHVGLIPYGATSTRGCAFGLLSTSYTYGGFTFEVENSTWPENTCSADVVAAYVTPFRTWSTSSLLPGRSKGWTWNNANPLSSIHLAGVDVPNVAGCSLQVSRTFYRQQPDGEREFVLYVRNNGTVECTGTVLLARVASSRTWSVGSLRPGEVRGAYDIAYPANQRPAPSAFRPAVFGFSPDGATDQACAMQINRMAFAQQPADGSASGAETYTMVLVQNTGSVTCSTTLLGAELS